MIRTRRILTPSKCGGQKCPEHPLVERITTTPEPAIDCQVTWNPWTHCEYKDPCKKGSRIRTRTIIQQPSPCGKPCVDMNEETDEYGCLPAQAVDCNWAWCVDPLLKLRP